MIRTQEAEPGDNVAAPLPQHSFIRCFFILKRFHLHLTLMSHGL